MKTPVLHALSASIWAAGLLTATTWAQTPQTPMTKGVTTAKSTLLRMPSAVTRISLGNPSVADVTLISATELYLLGKSYGSTNLIVWRKGSGPTAIDVNVNIDHQRMQAKLRELLPNEKGIQVRPAADSVILTGVVSSAVKAN